MQYSGVTIISLYTAENKEGESRVNIRNWSTD